MNDARRRVGLADPDASFRVVDEDDHRLGRAVDVGRVLLGRPEDDHLDVFDRSRSHGSRAYCRRSQCARVLPCRRLATSAVVTGAAAGLGLAVARQLAAEGTPVVGVDVDDAGLARAADEFGLEPVVGDVADWSTHERAAAAAEALGPLEGWVNNAGIDVQGAAHEVTAEEVDRGLRVLLVGTMAGTIAAVTHMLPNRRGSIVNVSSVQGVAAFPRYLVYGVAKAGVIHIARSVAVDYGPYGIRCNTVLPGTMDTPMTDSVLPAGISRATRRSGRKARLRPSGVSPRPEEVAEVVCFLLSERASYVTGASMLVDGGAAARCFAYPPLEL